jgi:hypothetical protein
MIMNDAKQTAKTITIHSPHHATRALLRAEERQSQQLISFLISFPFVFEGPKLPRNYPEITPKLKCRT